MPITVLNRFISPVSVMSEGCWGIYAGTSIADVFILKRLILFGSSEIT